MFLDHMDRLPLLSASISARESLDITALYANLQYCTAFPYRMLCDDWSLQRLGHCPNHRRFKLASSTLIALLIYLLRLHLLKLDRYI